MPITKTSRCQTHIITFMVSAEVVFCISDVTMNILFNDVAVNKLTKGIYYRMAPTLCGTEVNVTLDVWQKITSFSPVTCEGSHSTERIESMLMWASTDALLNNDCEKENGEILVNDINSGKKRKLQTLNQIS